MSRPTNDAHDDRVLKRVRALLDKAERTRDEFPAEADALESKAFELMGTYGIEQAMLAARGAREDEVTTIRITLSGGYARRLGTLVHGIAEAVGAKAIYTKPYRGNPARGLPAREAYSTVVGHESTLERVEFLYTLLLAQAMRGMGRIRSLEHGRTRSVRIGYLVGFADTVHERLVAAEKRARGEAAATATPGTPGVAVVLADRAALVRRRYAELFPNARTGGPVKVNAAGYRAGERDGRTADLGGARFGGGRARAIGS